jgi:hypothetical protein
MSNRRAWLLPVLVSPPWTRLLTAVAKGSVNEQENFDV